MQSMRAVLSTEGAKSMKVPCLHCGRIVAVNGLGRKRLGISVKKITDALQTCQNAELAAKELGCSRGYIYQELKKKGLKPKDVILSET